MPLESDCMSPIDFEELEGEARAIADRLKPGRWITPVAVLRAFRSLQDMTLLQLAAKTGNKVSTGRLSEYENGKMTPQIDRFIAIIDALGGVVIVRKGTKEWRLRND